MHLVLEKELNTNGVEKNDVDLTHVAKLIQNRLTLLTDVWQEANFFFIAPKDYDEKAVRKQWKDDTAKILSSVAELIDSADETTADTLGVLIKGYANDNGIGLGKIMAPLRIALVGSLRGPDVFEICSTIGVQNSISRINTAIKNLSI